MIRKILLVLSVLLVIAFTACTSSDVNLLSDPAMSGLSGKYSKVYIKMEKINDFGTIYLNDEKVLYAEYKNREAYTDWVDVTDKLNSGANTFHFVLENPWNSGSGLFMVKADEEILFSHFRSRIRANGVLYDETITLNW